MVQLRRPHRESGCSTLAHGCTGAAAPIYSLITDHYSLSLASHFALAKRAIPYGAMRSQRVSLWKEVCSRNWNQPPCPFTVSATLLLSFVPKSCQEL